MSDSASFLLLLFGAGVVIVLIRFLARRVAADLTDVEETKPGLLASFLFKICKTITVFGVVLVAFITIESWPPHWLQRMNQRKIVRQRVVEAGGWDVIKRDSLELVQKYTAAGYVWLVYAKPDENPPLPSSIAALKPKRVDFLFEGDGMCSVRINIFGGHATGVRGIDFYTLKVICPVTNVGAFKASSDPKRSQEGRKIADGIFEITHPS
jgi:hypothetical protein